jgi:hypothetical protein
MAASEGHKDKDDALLDLGGDEDEGGASRNSLQAGEVDLQEWERRLASGDDELLQNICLSQFKVRRWNVLSSEGYIIDM